MFRKRKAAYTVTLQYDTGLKRGCEVFGPDGRELLFTRQRNYIGLTIGPEKFRAFSNNKLMWTLSQSLFLSRARLHVTEDYSSAFDQRLLLGMILVLSFSTLKRPSNASSDTSNELDFDMLFR